MLDSTHPEVVLTYRNPLEFSHGGMIGSFGHIVWINGSDQYADEYTNTIETGGFCRFGSIFVTRPETDENVRRFLRLSDPLPRRPRRPRRP